MSPKVGAKSFPYSPAGKAAAAKEAVKTGQPMRSHPPPKKGK